MQTFDEWHLAKYGVSFDDLHMQPETHIGTAMRALTVALRVYITEMVAPPEPCLHVRLHGSTCEDCGAKFDIRAEVDWQPV